MTGGQNVNQYLIDFNAANWATQANAQLQTALSHGLQYSENYSQQAIKATQAFQAQSRNDQSQGFERSQALNAPMRLAGYNALDSYLGLLGQPTPQGGSFKLASALENPIQGQQNTPQQEQMAAGFNQGIQNFLPQQRGGVLQNVQQ